MKIANLLAAAAVSLLAAAPASMANPCETEPCRVAASGSAPLSLFDFLGRKSEKKKAAKPAETTAPRREPKLARPLSSVPNEAYAAAYHYMSARPQKAVRIVDSSEHNEIDAAADMVRIVDSQQLNEIDLLAQPVRAPVRNSDQEIRTVGNNPDAAKDDDLFERILMTFAGALAIASGMRVLIG